MAWSVQIPINVGEENNLEESASSTPTNTAPEAQAQLDALKKAVETFLAQKGAFCKGPALVTLVGHSHDEADSEPSVNYAGDFVSMTIQAELPTKVKNALAKEKISKPLNVDEEKEKA